MPTFMPSAGALTWPVVALAAACVFLARLCYRFLPSGVPEATFAVSLSAAALSAAGAGDHSDEALNRASLVASLLCAAWNTLARVPGSWSRHADPALRASVFRHASGLCGAASAGLILVAASHQPGAPLATLSLLVLACSASLHAPRAADSRFSIAPLALIIAAGAVPLARWAQVATLIGLAAGALGFTLIIAEGLIRRRRRIAAAGVSPRDLVDTPFGHPVIGFASMACAAISLAACGAACDRRLAPLAAFLAALTAFNVFHRHGWRLAAEIGFAGVLLTWTTFCTALLPWPEARPLDRAALGLACGTLNIVWLARFWTQQLLDAQPWTTAGRLVPIARTVARAMPLPLLAIGVACMLSGHAAEPAIPITAAGLLLVGAFAAENRTAADAGLAEPHPTLLVAAVLTFLPACPLPNDLIAMTAAATGASALGLACIRVAMFRAGRGALGLEHAIWLIALLPIVGAMVLIQAHSGWDPVLALGLVPLAVAPLAAAWRAREGRGSPPERDRI